MARSCGEAWHGRARAGHGEAPL